MSTAIGYETHNHLDQHYLVVTKSITDGRLVFFLGAGASLYGRPNGAAWHGRYLPSAKELAEHLADTYGFAPRGCPNCERADLLRVSQYAAGTAGWGGLYGDLHKIFNFDYPFTSLHHFLAILPRLLREKGCKKDKLLVVTTNYDDLMERAFVGAGEEVDVVTYMAEGEHRGMCLHWPPKTEAQLIDKPNAYPGSLLEARSVVLKIHGAVNRKSAQVEDDSYVITEDDYIEYLAHATDVAKVLPAVLVAKLKESHVLFLGYSLRDWNLRAILYRIWEKERFKFRSWAIQSHPDSLERRSWSKRNVDIVDEELDDYVDKLRKRIENLHLSASQAA